MDKTNEFSFLLKTSMIPGAGVGVFAVHDIYIGTKLAVLPDWEESRLLKKKDVPKAFLGICIPTSGGWLICPQQFNKMWIGWYMNDSVNPNAKLDEGHYYAIRNISAGEEILINYDIFKKLLLRK